MNKLNSIAVLSLSAALITAFLSGCEELDVSPASSKVKITPDSVALTEGQSQLFTASGGYEYTWSLKNEGWGMLSTYSGSQTTYTSLYTPGSNSAVQILFVTSSIPNNVGSSSSNANPVVNSGAEAHITHISYSY